MTGSLLPTDDEMMERRINSQLNEVSRRLNVFRDGVANWKERLPEFRGSPRRWDRDDANATTVGEALLSRYGGYDWFVIEELLKQGGSLDRAFSRGRMTAEQKEIFSEYRQMLNDLRPMAEDLGLIAGWPPDVVPENVLDHCGYPRSAEPKRHGEQDDPPELPIGSELDG